MTNDQLNIVIVEDNEMYSILLNHKLKNSFNARLNSYTSGEEFLANLELEKNTDLILLDYNLPGMNGLSTLQQIKEKSPDTEVIILSNQNIMQIAIDSLKEGAFDYVIKNEEAIERIINSIYKIERNKQIRDENLTLKIKVNKYRSIVGTLLAVLFAFIATMVTFFFTN